MLGSRVASGCKAGLRGIRARRRRAFSAGVVRGVAATLLGTSGCGRLCSRAGGVGALAASFVLHGFLRGSKGSVPDCPLRSLPIVRQEALLTPSLCLCSVAREIGSIPTRTRDADDAVDGSLKDRWGIDPFLSCFTRPCPHACSASSPASSPASSLLTRTDAAARGRNAVSLRLAAQRQGEFPNFPPDVQITWGLKRIVPFQTSFKRALMP